MEKIVECVPNFSEGGDAGIIRQITDTISAVDGIDLRAADPGADQQTGVGLALPGENQQSSQQQSAPECTDRTSATSTVQSRTSST